MSEAAQSPTSTKPPENPARVLVICLRYVGDSLLLRAPLRALRTKFPNAQLDALVARGTARALEGCASVDRVIEWPSGSIFSQGAAVWKLRSVGYDWAVDFTGNDRTAFVALATGARWRIAYDRPKLPSWSLRRAAFNVLVPHRKKKPHTVLQRLELLEACGVPSAGTEAGLKPSPEGAAWASRVLSDMPRPLLHAHLSSRDMQKAIPAGRARDVFRGFTARGGSVVLTCGSGEVEKAHASAAIEGISCSRIFERTTWDQLVALVAAADFYWGADTAPAHVASALGKKLLVEFGPSRADHWYPLNPEARWLVHECRCLKEKLVTCPHGTPGACMESAGGPEVRAWLQAG